MSAFKQFLSTDIIISPLEVNKGFTFNGDEFSIIDSSSFGLSTIGTDSSYELVADTGMVFPFYVSGTFPLAIFSGSNGDFVTIPFNTLLIPSPLYDTSSYTFTPNFDFIGNTIIQVSSSYSGTDTGSLGIRLYENGNAVPNLSVINAPNSINTLNINNFYFKKNNTYEVKIVIGAFKQPLDFTASVDLSNNSFWKIIPTIYNNGFVGIDRFLGKNITSSLFNPLSDPTTGNNYTQYQRLIYNSIKELYYSNHLSSSYSDSVNTASLVPGNNIEGNRLTGSSQSNGRYYNYPQTTLTFEKYFPTSSDALIGVISIPTKLIGNGIQPKSFRFTAESGSIYDDGEGNLIYSGSGLICGNIFYAQGLAIITSDSNPGQDVYGSAVYGASSYGVSDTTVINNFITSSNVTCSFSSSLIIYETQYKCTVRENEFNYSLNPSIISGSTDGTIYNFATGSDFSPFITTIGLYDDNKNLLAVAKLAQPIPSTATTDLNLIINLDR